MSPCILHVGYIDKDGYGRLTVDGRRGTLAHRHAYEQAVGPIPAGMTIDHRCRNRACVNVTHMQVVTRKTNTLRGEGPTAVNARKTHCIHGHPLTKRGGRRICHQCEADAARRYRGRPA